MMTSFTFLELNGGTVEQTTAEFRLTVPPTASGYTDAQIDDYGKNRANGRSRFKHYPGTRLDLRARFSLPINQLMGTAGFGFWNAPVGDPTVKRLALPQAIWFFFASPPNNLPFYQQQPGRGWSAATLNATTWRALRWSPFTPLVLLLNQFKPIRARLWPKVQADLGVSSTLITAVSTDWHQYTLEWQKEGCRFLIDGEEILSTPVSPSGPLGFVCWIDNQFMVATGNGRFNWGTLPLSQKQTLEIADLTIHRLP